MLFKIRQYEKKDRAQVIALWERCDLIVPLNDPSQDIAAKVAFQPELFLVGELDGSIIASIMVGYEGHRGWINYMGVEPRYQRRGYGKKLMERAMRELKRLGCPKVNLQVRETNKEAIAFYEKLGFTDDLVISLGKQLGANRKTVITLMRKERSLEPQFKKLDDMIVVGLQTLNTCQHNVIPRLWQRFLKREKEVQHVVVKNVGLGVSFGIEKKEKESEFFHIVGHIVNSIEDIPEGMTYRKIPAHEYAVFTHKGLLSTLGETYDFIYGKWIPESKYEYDDSNEIEWYDERFDPKAEDSEFDIYVPIKKT